MVVWMPDTISVFEFKTNQRAKEALEQIGKKGYTIPYQTDGRRVVKVGVKFNVETRTPKEWTLSAT